MEGMLTADFPDVTIEERQVRNTMQSLKGNSNTNATRQCRRLLERLLEVQHNEDPDMIIVQLLDEEDRLKGVFFNNQGCMYSFCQRLRVFQGNSLSNVGFQSALEVMCIICLVTMG
eukprot:jgi/Tetstr1/466295/TSEL_010828.t1